MSKKIPTGKGYFDQESTKKMLWKILWGLCILFVLLEIPLHRHGHFGDKSIDGIFAFYALLGFLSCFLCILVAKLLGVFLKVKEDYYDN